MKYWLMTAAFILPAVFLIVSWLNRRSEIRDLKKVGLAPQDTYKKVSAGKPDPCNDSQLYFLRSDPCNDSQLCIRPRKYDDD